MVNMGKYKRSGWFNDSHRHYLAAKGIKTTNGYFISKRNKARYALGLPYEPGPAETGKTPKVGVEEMYPEDLAKLLAAQDRMRNEEGVLDQDKYHQYLRDKDVLKELNDDIVAMQDDLLGTASQGRAYTLNDAGVVEEYEGALKTKDNIQESLDAMRDRLAVEGLDPIEIDELEQSIAKNEQRLQGVDRKIEQLRPSYEKLGPVKDDLLQKAAELRGKRDQRNQISMGINALESVSQVPMIRYQLGDRIITSRVAKPELEAQGWTVLDITAPNRGKVLERVYTRRAEAEELQRIGAQRSPPPEQILQGPEQSGKTASARVGGAGEGIVGEFAGEKQPKQRYATPEEVEAHLKSVEQQKQERLAKAEQRKAEDAQKRITIASYKELGVPLPPELQPAEKNPLEEPRLSTSVSPFRRTLRKDLKEFKGER